MQKDKASVFSNHKINNLKSLLMQRNWETVLNEQNPDVLRGKQSHERKRLT